MFGREKLGKILIKEGIINKYQLNDALDKQKENGMKLGYNLVQMGFVDEETLANVLSEQHNCPSLSCSTLSTLKIDDDVLNLIPFQKIQQNAVLPISRVKSSLTVVVGDPSDKELLSEISNITGLSIKPVVAPQSVLSRLIEKQSIKKTVTKMLDGNEEVEHISSLFAELSDFKLEKIIGAGGFGEVYKCYQKSLDRYVAIKTLSKIHANSKDYIERFRQEGKIIARLNHPNIVKIMELGEMEKYYYFVMEYIEGLVLNNFLADKDIITKLYTFIQVADALGCAHKSGIIHRDIKPGNVLVDKNNIAKLLDFGISLVTQREDTRITNPNLVLGTPRYMSPEQKEDSLNIDQRSDIYSLGAVMYEVFANKPFDPERIIHPSEHNKNIPPGLNNAILKCLADKKEDRFESCDQLRFILSIIKDRLVLSKEILEYKGKEDTGVSIRDSFIIKNNYEFITQFNKTNDSETFLAEHKGLGKLVVIKRYSTKRGLTEAKMLSRLNHPKVADVLGIGDDERRFIIIREYLDGGSYREFVKNEQPGMDKIIVIVKEIVQALDFAYKNKIIHNNIHPNNILFSSAGNMKLTDFNVDSTLNTALKRYTAFKYNNPMHNDFYSIGVILFEIVAGCPFLVDKDITFNYKKLLNTRIQPAQITKTISKLWGVFPDGNEPPRYQSFTQLLSDIELIERKLLK